MSSSQSFWRHRNFLFPLFLLLATFIAYLPAWHGGFLWKDDQFILHNPYINFWQGLYRIWFKTSVQYYPLTYTTFWIEYHFWGMNPLGYHLVNIAFHVLDAVLLWRVLLRLKVPGAWLAAAIFALHPINVESVAWIVERKNTLSTVFYLCAILAALKFWLPGLGTSKPDQSVPAGEPAENSPRPKAIPSLLPSDGRGEGQGEVRENPHSKIANQKYYWLAFALFVCALFCKTTTIPFPAVILLLVWWKRGNITLRDVYPCIPFLMAGVAVGLITHHVEHDLGASGKAFQFSLVDRILLAAKNFWFYLGKLVWPHPLMFVYPRWTIRASSPWAWLPLLAFVPVAAVLWLNRRTWGRPVFVALAYFGGLLFLMLGFFNIFFFLYSFVSDHFVYLACMGPIALFAAALTLAFRKQSPGAPVFGGGATVYLTVSACVLLVLAALTFSQARAYANAETLWRDTVAKNPDAFLARNNLGDLLLEKGELDAAIEQYQKSLALHADAVIYHNLGNALLQRGRSAEAFPDFKKALQLQPNSATSYLDLGTYYLQIGRTDLARQYLERALQLNPDLAMAAYNLGNAYFKERQLNQAIGYWQRAARIQPNFVLANNNLANAMIVERRTPDAVRYWERVLVVQPDTLSAQVNLAWVWATCPDTSLRDGPDALALAGRATQLTGGRNPLVLRVLAAAFAENGQYANAIAAAQEGIQLARNSPGLTANIQEQLKYYQAHQPFRDPTLAPHSK